MAISRLQVASGGGDGSQGTSVTAIFGSSVTSGSLIIVGTRNSTNTQTGISDTLGTSYTLIGPVDNDVTMRLYYGVAPSGGSNTVTCTFSATNYVWVYAIEVSDASVLDASDTQTGANTTDMTTDPITTSAAAYVVMMVSEDSVTTFSAGTDFTLVDGTIPTNPQNFGGVEEYITSGVLSSYTPHFTSTHNNVNYVAIVAAFKVAAVTANDALITFRKA